ncbi:type 3 dihydrofolate reductase [Vibrio aquimaris]|uniref:Dihydrofolate reductase n=1 Tax=Vibrio aquimaris TaxID=2587862 RepID=A0A5P9CG71_9VIBR|nr:type 3 dihydrofolate reductase [Vibrio aquimaris]QFT25260.1 Dihydrofolate reductase type 3 [Vibrio aquimaris]
MVISMIAALAGNSSIGKDSPHVIGNDNAMPWHLPADFTWFKKHTIGKPVIMGRKTFESIGRPLPDRRNIVITRNPEFSSHGVTIVSSLDSALAEASDCHEVMIIGGGSIYKECLPLADKLYITFVEAELSGDTFFPKWSHDFKETYSETYLADEKNAYNMRFVILEK